MKRYPEEFPRPTIAEGYSLQAENNIQRTPLQNGRARQRQRFTSAPSFVRLTWILTSDLKARVFEAWIRQVVGADWFEMPIRSPMGTPTERVRLTESMDGPIMIGPGMWKYTAPVEIWATPMFEPGWVEFAPQFVAVSDIFDRAMLLEWPESPYQTHMSAVDTAINQEWPEYEL